MTNYETFSLADALKPRPKQPMLVESILPAGSISIWYGYPGSLKSALVMDMCMAIATGKNWIPGMPNSVSNGHAAPGYKTTQVPVLWIDMDNGFEITAERVAAFSRTYRAPVATPFYFMSYPTPALQAVSLRSVAGLQAHIMNNMAYPPGIMVVDTLLRAAHVKDENASEMDTVLNNLHKLAEDLKTALVMISHSKKENSGRAGNGLRGHSSIEGGVDYVFQVKRDDHSDIVEIENQKARRRPIDPFSVRWTYMNDIDGEALQEARFYFNGKTSTMTKQQATILSLCAKIVDELNKGKPMNNSELFKAVGGNRANYDEALKKTIADKVVSMKAGPYNAFIYEAI
jgi:hypothetical protein